MNGHTAIGVAALILCAPSFAEMAAQESGKSFTLILNSDTLTACGYRILRRTPDGDRPVARFTFPTLSMLLQYRPQIRDNYGFNTSRYALKDIITDISSEINSVCVSEDSSIWVGFGYYEGEGYDGIGGIGFYDPHTGATGVLRHPALLDYSVGAIKVTKDTIYAVTRGYYEGGGDVGNGLVAISRRSLDATARVPPGTSALWGSDDGQTVAPLYERPIDELISDVRFLPKPIPQWPEKTLDTIRALGPGLFMTHTLARERSVRQTLISQAEVLYDEVIRASGPDHIVGGLVGKSGIKLDTPGPEELKPNCGVDGFACFVINLPGNMWFSEWYEIQVKPPRVLTSQTVYYHNWLTARPGDSWTFERFDKTLVITIDSLIVKEVRCPFTHPPLDVDYFESAAIHLTYLRLMN